MLFWKRKWKKELDCAIPALDSKIINSVSENVKAESVRTVREKGNKVKCIPRLVGIAVALALCCVTLATVITPPTSVVNAAVVVEINPAIAFTLKDGKVDSIKSLNADADIIVSDGDFINSVSGKSADTATEIFVAAASKYGFIDYSDAAVRVSSYGEVDVDKITGRVENYLLQAGVPSVVFSRSLDKNGFTDLIGLNGGGDVIKLLQSAPELYLEREVEGKTEQELKDIYESKVMIGNVMNSVTDMIKAFRTQSDCIQRIKETDFRIKEIDGRSYWDSVDVGHGNPQSAALKAEMEGLIEEFRKLTGIFIDGNETLKERDEYYCLNEENVSMLEQLVNAPEDLSAIINEVCNIFGISNFSALLEPPKTPEEYDLKLKESLGYLRESKTSANVLEYSKPREPLNKDDNDGRINDLKNEYGTLEDFWEHKADKKN